MTTIQKLIEFTTRVSRLTQNAIRDSQRRRLGRMMAIRLDELRAREIGRQVRQNAATAKEAIEKAVRP